jgi:hypothetical protein
MLSGDCIFGRLLPRRREEEETRKRKQAREEDSIYTRQDRFGDADKQDGIATAGTSKEEKKRINNIKRPQQAGGRLAS